tara:strand:- start:279 stop:416 length:138 start_codon:yes stop_codon:yes gene_type:complete
LALFRSFLAIFGLETEQGANFLLYFNIFLLFLEEKNMGEAVQKSG